MPRSEKFPDFPSVTEVLEGVGLARYFAGRDRDMYLARGRALHAAIEYHHAGELDEATLHPQIRPGFEAYLAWLGESGHVPECSEMEVVNTRVGYVGHLDRIGTVDGERALIDFKYSNSPDLKAARYQLGGYRAAWWEGRPEALSAPLKRSYVLALSPTTGRPKLHDLTDDYAEQVFFAAVMVYRAKQGGR